MIKEYNNKSLAIDQLKMLKALYHVAYIEPMEGYGVRTLSRDEVWVYCMNYTIKQTVIEAIYPYPRVKKRMKRDLSSALSSIEGKFKRYRVEPHLQI